MNTARDRHAADLALSLCDVTSRRLRQMVKQRDPANRRRFLESRAVRVAAAAVLKARAVTAREAQ